MVWQAYLPLRGESQIFRHELHHPALGAQKGHIEGGLGAAGDSQVQIARAMRQKIVETAVDGHLVNEVILVQHQSQVRRQGSDFVNEEGERKLGRAGLPGKEVFEGFLPQPRAGRLQGTH
jgi:hypothetical protein